MADKKRVGYTISQLKEMCEQQIQKGNGDKQKRKWKAKCPG